MVLYNLWGSIKGPENGPWLNSVALRRGEVREGF